MKPKSLFQKINLKFLLSGIFLAFITASLLQTYPLLKSQFTIYDDIGVAETLLYRNMDYINNCEKNLQTMTGKITFFLWGSKKKPVTLQQN